MQRFARHGAIMTGPRRARITQEQFDKAEARLKALADRQSTQVDFSKQEVIDRLLPLLKRCGHHRLAAVVNELNGDELDYTVAALKSCAARANKALGEGSTALGAVPVMPRDTTLPGQRGGRSRNGGGGASTGRRALPSSAPVTPSGLAAGTEQRSSSAFQIDPN